jgi:hypothetical protein
MPFIARSNEAPTRPRSGSSPLGRAKVLLITGMLGMIAAPLVFGQPDDDNGIRYPSAAGGLTARKAPPVRTHRTWRPVLRELQWGIEIRALPSIR